LTEASQHAVCIWVGAHTHAHMARMDTHTHSHTRTLTHPHHMHMHMHANMMMHIERIIQTHTHMHMHALARAHRLHACIDASAVCLSRVGEVHLHARTCMPHMHLSATRIYSALLCFCFCFCFINLFNLSILFFLFFSFIVLTGFDLSPFFFHREGQLGYTLNVQHLAIFGTVGPLAKGWRCADILLFSTCTI